MGIYDEHVPESGGGLYLKLEDGKTYDLRIMSEPVIFDNVFEQPGKPVQISTKYAWVVWNNQDKMSQILQLPVTGYRMIADIAKNPKWGDPASGKYDISVKRTGSGLDTVYSVLPTPSDGAELSKEEKEELEKIDLIEAIEKGKGSERVQWLKDALKGRPAREANTAKATPTKQKDDVVIEDIGDEPINLDDIPF